MGQAWYTFPISQAHGVNGEQGVDLATPFHTPITALYAGTVRWAGRTQWSCGSSGGEVTIVCNVPGVGVMTSYYLHLDTTDVNVGDTVRAGQQIGLSGGQLSGGQWPVVNCPSQGDIYSTGPHSEFGFNASWVSGPGHNIDPTFAITQARQGTLPITSADGTAIVSNGAAGAGAQQVQIDPVASELAVLKFQNLSIGLHKVITQPTGFAGICEAIDADEQWQGWNWENIPESLLVNVKPVAIRFGVMSICMTVIALIIGSYLLGFVGSAVKLAAGISGATGAGAGAGAAGAAGASGAGAALAEAPEIAAL